MIDDAYAGKINCILVKDLSRFGRNYIECGIYLYKIFPNLKVRFISILDQYDSLNEKDDNNFELMLRSIINHSYSMDISDKVKVVQSLDKATAAIYLLICHLDIQKVR